MASKIISKDAPGVYLMSFAIYVEKRGTIAIQQASSESFADAVQDLLSSAGYYSSASFSVEDYQCVVSGDIRNHQFNVDNKGFEKPRAFVIQEKLATNSGFGQQLGNLVRECFKQGSTDEDDNIFEFMESDNYIRDLSQIDATGRFHPLAIKPV